MMVLTGFFTSLPLSSWDSRTKQNFHQILASFLPYCVSIKSSFLNPCQVIKLTPKSSHSFHIPMTRQFNTPVLFHYELRNDLPSSKLTLSLPIFQAPRAFSFTPSWSLLPLLLALGIRVCTGQRRQPPGDKMFKTYVISLLKSRLCPDSSFLELHFTSSSFYEGLVVFVFIGLCVF